MADRKSEAEFPALIDDPIVLAQAEAKNALAQFDWAVAEVGRWIKSGQPQLKISMLLNLHRLATTGIDRYAGVFRPASVEIKGSSHKPISGDDVPRYVEEMLEYLSENWQEKTAIHLCAFAMWRLNWIHPFTDGNGRTSRILSYMVLCGRLEQMLPGTKTIPEQISENKTPYYDALEKADMAYKKGKIDVSAMERLLEAYLAKQLVSVHENATGNNVSHAQMAKPPRHLNWINRLESKPVFVGAVVVIVATFLSILFG